MDRHFLTAFVIVTMASGSFAQQPGDLDSSFSADGFVTTDIVSDDDLARAMAIQPDGKIVVAGTTYESATHFIVLTRYLTDGGVDASFGTDGVVITTVDASNANDVEVQPDGKILVAGTWLADTTGTGILLVRYNADGSPDASFGDAGIVMDDLSASHDGLASIAMQPDGKILVAGTINDLPGSDFLVMRYHTDGTLDSSFSDDGIQITDIEEVDTGGGDIAWQPDGYIVVAGCANTGSSIDYVLIRYGPNGTLDPTFGTNGIVITALTTGDDRPADIVLQPDGKIVIGGRTGPTLGWMAVSRYNPDGTLDGTFSGGHVLVIVGIGSYASGAALLPDGRIVAGGNSSEGFLVVLFNTDGTLDSTFSTNGIQTTSLGFSTTADMGIQSDGKILLAGTLYSATTLYDLAVLRYLFTLDVGLVAFTSPDPAPLIYPNPIGQTATLNYALARDERITIALVDIEGRTVQRFIESALQQAGEHQVELTFDASIAPGPYLLTIADAKGARVNVQVVKQ